MVNYQTLINKISESGYVDMTPSDIISALKLKNIQVINSNPVMVRYRTVANTYGLSFAEKIMSGLETAASGTGVVAKTITRLLPTILNDSNDSGIDMSNLTVRGLIDNLTTGDDDSPIVFDEADADKLKDMGCVYTSWADQNNCPNLDVGHIEWARKMISDGVSS
jgi:hypothetical protein